MKRIYVCSRLRGDEGITQAQNELAACHHAKYVVEEGYGAPFVPHLLYPRFLDDTIPSEREMGIDAGMAYMRVCEEVFVFMDASRLISDGMRAEIEWALEHAVPVRAFIRFSDGTYDEVMELVDRWREEGIR